MLLRILPHRALAASLIAALPACRSAPDPAPTDPLDQPGLRLRESYAPGNIVAGPGATDVADPAVAAAVSARCRLLYLERSFAGTLQPVELVGTFVVDLRGETPVLDTPRLVSGGRVGSGPAAEEWLAALARGEAGRVREVFTGRPALPVGATYTIEASAPETVEDPVDWLDEFPDRGPIDRAVSFALSHDATGPRLALGVADLDPLAEQRSREEQLEAGRIEPGPPPPAEDEILRRETLLLDRALALGETLVATLPSPFREGEGRLFALVVEADEAAPATERVTAVEAALAQVARAHARRTGPISVGQTVELLREQALTAFQQRGSRSALLLLAAETDALLAEDLALSAPDKIVAALSASVFAGGEEAVGANVGWRLESTAWRVVCRRVLESEDEPELRAPLFRHAGALAAYPDVVLDALAASADLAGFRARLAEEHLYFLDDPDPSARLRAHDWLRARELAVEGYDPFAPREERRAALERAREAREASAQEGDQ